jgi:hypothetical protein
MRVVHIISNNLAGYKDGFFKPLRLYKNLLADRGVTIRFLLPEQSDSLDAGTVIVASEAFNTLAGEAKRDRMVAFLATARAHCERLCFFDLTDGPGSIYSNVLPYVDKYLKPYLFRNRLEYTRQRYANRMFCDYYHKAFGIRDSKPFDLFPAVPEEQISKLHLAWNYAYGHFGISSVPLSLFRPKVLVRFLDNYPGLRFAAPTGRTRELSARISANYSHETVAHQRRLVRQIVEAWGGSCERISRFAYFTELRKSRLAISPFGWGEICIRDFEVFISGATLVKPDLGHLETYPNLYQPYQTYLPFSWDCEDLPKILKEGPSSAEARDIGINGQRLYRQTLFDPAARIEFCDRFVKLTAN